MDNEELPELDLAILTVVLNRTTGEVEVNYEGMNYLEAIGLLVVGRNQVQDDCLEEWEYEDEED